MLKSHDFSYKIVANLESTIEVFFGAGAAGAASPPAAWDPRSRVGLVWHGLRKLVDQENGPQEQAEGDAYADLGGHEPEGDVDLFGGLLEDLLDLGVDHLPRVDFAESDEAEEVRGPGAHPEFCPIQGAL